LTLCYAGDCENATLTRITPNHIDFTDNNNNTISLTRIKPTATSTFSAIRETELKEMLRNQNNVTTLYNNGKLQADLKNYTGAQSLYQRALSIEPNDVQVLSDMGRVLYNLQNYTGALHSLDKALSINSSSVYGLMEGVCIIPSGRLQASVSYYGQSVDTEPI
jgi:tetratricopeptide (TPR) repeat protein